MKPIDLDDLRASLDYNLDTGIFTWRTQCGPAQPGTVAGNINAKGYPRIGFRGHVVLSARLAWFYVYGEWPSHQVNHRDGNRLNNSINNLQVHVHSSKLPPLTAERLREIVIYDPLTGLFARRSPRRKPAPGAVGAGYTRPNGYVMLTVDGQTYRAHRLAWLYVHGQWPTKHIDHINGNPVDNRLSNLREATVAENMANSKRPITNKSGYKGVNWHKGAKKWTSRIRVRGTTIYLGLFDTPEAAHDAYCAKARETKGEFARTE